MIGVYFSGTGNTKHCLTRLVNGLDKSAIVYAMEDSNALSAIKNSDTVIFGYPVQYSNLPKIVRDFINTNSTVFRGKKIFIIATMGLFSGDGAGRSARLFEKYGATVLGGLHVRMPDCIGDTKMLKKTLEQNRRIIEEADKKIDRFINEIKESRFSRHGLKFVNLLAGLFGQRLYFPNKTRRYYKGIKVDHDKCVQCGLCTRLCPMNNVSLVNNKIAYNNKCTMCYRCFSNCPKKAITILGKRVVEQCKYDNYVANK